MDRHRRRQRCSRPRRGSRGKQVGSGSRVTHAFRRRRRRRSHVRSRGQDSGRPRRGSGDARRPRCRTRRARATGRHLLRRPAPRLRGHGRGSPRPPRDATRRRRRRRVRRVGRRDDGARDVQGTTRRRRVEDADRTRDGGGRRRDDGRRVGRTRLRTGGGGGERPDVLPTERLHGHSRRRRGSGNVRGSRTRGQSGGGRGVGSRRCVRRRPPVGPRPGRPDSDVVSRDAPRRRGVVVAEGDRLRRAGMFYGNTCDANIFRKL